MRYTTFGDPILESIDDDLSVVLRDYDSDEIYARVMVDEVLHSDGTPRWCFDVMTNEDGDSVATSESIFTSEKTCRDYLRTWLAAKDIQTTD